ncbi:TIGR03943 family protein [Lysinibacillus sp. B2A1]|nr:TIGR03943 family protein [Lysinibacillus sp. B2A1]
MRFHFQQAVKAAILFAFSAMIYSFHMTGNITKLINPKYDILSKIVAIIFLFLFVVQLKRVFTFSKQSNSYRATCGCCSHHQENTSLSIKKGLSYFILIVPIVTGLIIPTKVLDASIAEKKGATIMMTNQSQALTGDDDIAMLNDSTEGHPVDPNLLEKKQEMPKKEYDLLKQQLASNPIIEMTDYVYSVYYEDINNNLLNYQGKSIHINGFVLKEDDFEQNQLVISRFLITHCVADASIIGFLSEIPEASNLEEDTWIEAEGIIDIGYYNGVELPLLKIHKWKEIEIPDEPYLYPIDILISK